MSRVETQVNLTNHPRFRRPALVSLLLLLAFATAGCDMVNAGSKAAPTARTTAVSQPATLQPSTPATATNAKNVTATEIDELLFRESGIYGVVVVEADGTMVYSRNCTTPFITASLYKLVLLANIYQMREHGELTFDQLATLQPEYFPTDSEPADSYFNLSMVGGTDTIADLIFATGAYSSNVAARALLDLTTHDALNATARDLGLVNTHLFVDPATLAEWPPTPSSNTRAEDTEKAMRFAVQSAADGPVNLTTPCDMARFFQLLQRGEIVSQQASAELADILAQQAVDNRFPVLLPAGTKMVHKTGNLEHVVHDAGILYHNDMPTILIAMSEGMVDDDRSTQIIQRLALIAYGDDDIPSLPSPRTPSADAPPAGDG